MTASARSNSYLATRRLAIPAMLVIFALAALAGAALAGHTLAIGSPAAGADLGYGTSHPFTAVSTSGVCTPGAITWTFGDGDGASGASVSHAYAVATVGTTRTVAVVQAFTGAGNHCINAPTRSASITVDIVDGTSPTIDAVADIVAEAASALGAEVAFDAPGSHDEVDGDGVATCDASSGTYPLGVTTVTCSATDAAGNAAADEVFTITVVDTTKPVIDEHADESVETSSPAGAALDYGLVMSSDAVDGDQAASCSPMQGSTFPIGVTTVTCSRTDVANNVATPVTFTVTVVRSAAFPIEVTVATDEANYNAVDALTGGVSGTVTVAYLGDGFLEGAHVVVTLSNNGVVNDLMVKTFEDDTDADGEFSFDVPQEFTLPGVYGITVTVTYAAATGGADTVYTVLV